MQSSEFVRITDQRPPRLADESCLATRSRSVLFRIVWNYSIRGKTHGVGQRRTAGRRGKLTRETAELSFKIGASLPADCWARQCSGCFSGLFMCL